MEIDPADLAHAVGHDVGEFVITPIDPDLRFHSTTGGVFRVDWNEASLVIKVVRHGHDEDPGALWVSGATPDHRNYWKREWLAFDSGLLDSLPGQLRAPQTLLTTQPSPDESWIWMEDVEGRHGATWPVGDYASVAFDLGTTQGAYAAGVEPLPTADWLSRDWLRGWVDALERHSHVVEDDAVWAAEPLQMLDFLRDRYAAIWARREELLTIVEAAPQCVVHCDFWPHNLIAADDGTTVAVDWSQVGIGAVGQDLDQLTLDSVWMQVLPDVDIEDIEAQVVPSYLAGLQANGADVSADELDAWYAAAAAAHYGPMLTMYAMRLAEPGRTEALERRHDRPIEAISADKARVVERALTLGERVLGL
ncbi:MAG TPA: phosphotransferase [Mycobacteriales bacterium]|nr:phosphotransferase [Mycobacteriales bacterium]